MKTGEIEVVGGPDRGMKLELPLGRRVVVGRGERSDLRLSDANVSRRHCVLEHRLAGIFAHDLASRSGTLLDDRPLTGSRGERLPEEAELALGETRLVVRRTSSGGLPTVPGVTLSRELGRGGSGIVYEGTTEAGDAVAVKVLLTDADDVSRRRFEREVNLRERLEHPGIAQIRALVRVGERPCLVRELVPGPSLAERLEEGPLTAEEAAQLGIAIGEALCHAHSVGVVHRDVKPGNVILGPDGPKLIDFDLAKRLVGSSLTRLTETGQGLGSLSYLAPEQLTGARDVGVEADVHGLGMTLYHAVSGRRPFADVEPEDFFDALYREGPEPLATAAPALPAPFRRVLERACARQAADRFPDMRTLVESLQAVV